MKAEKKVRECGCHGLGQPIKKERRPKLRELSAVLQYPDPGSNRDGLLHWCLRPARLPIPPSGLNADAKVRIFFLTTKFLGQKITEQILNL